VHSDAVQLFVERVTALEPSFQVTERNASAIAETCRRLDGIPLALELAAAHVPTLGVDEVVHHLDDRFRLLIGSDRSAPSRHQTLRATIDWSYALLDQPERGLLDRLSVFAGGCTLHAVEAVCGSDDDDGVGVESSAMLGPLETLIAKSLVIAEPNASGGMRYHLLETVRTYAAERLAERGETTRVRRRHAGYFTALAQQAEPELNGTAQVSWLERLELEHDNLRLALAWTLEHDLELGLRLGAALVRFWFVRGHLSEGAAWLNRLLQRPGDATHTAARANALMAAGILAWHRADTDQAEAHLRASLDLRREAPDDARLSRTLYELAKVLSQRGDHASARAFGEQALARWRQAGDTWGTAVALNFLGELLREERDLVEAGRSYEESRQLFEVAGDSRGLAIATHNLGIVAMEQGHFDRARALHRATLPLKRNLGDREGLAATLVNLAYLAVRAGDAARAARLCGVAELAHESIGAVLPPWERTLAVKTVDLARAALGNTAFSAEWENGRRLSLDQAVTEALEPDAVGLPPSLRGAGGEGHSMPTHS
jgi:non-specific serine/threonine protein kinase